MEEKLVKSKYLQKIKLDENYYLIYHSLYGNITKVNNQVMNLINNIDYSYSREINYLKKKMFLVSEKCDEYESIRNRINGREELLKRGGLVGEIQLSVSNRCNMNCKYCFEKKFDNSIRNWSEKMTFETARNTIEKVLGIVKDNDRDHIGINFFGGEPLTNIEVIEKVIRHFKNGEDYGTKIYYSIDTNGILINESIAELFAEYKVLVNLSIDYKSSSNILYRGEGNPGASFRDFDRSLKILKGKGVVTYFLSVLSEDTYDRFSNELIDYAVENNVTGNDVILSFDLDFKRKHNSEEIVKRLVEYYSYGRHKDFYVGGYWGSIINQMEGNSARNIEGFKCCPAIGRRLSIEPNGDVFSCKSSSRRHGNIENINQVLSSETYNDYGMRAFRNADSCSGCIIEGFCSGACLGLLENTYGNIRTVDPFLCEVYKKLTLEILKVKYSNQGG